MHTKNAMDSQDETARVDATQRKLNEAFRLMRSRGLVARQRFSCCNSCAGYKIATEIENKLTVDPQKKSEYQGCCFYSKQSGLRDRGRPTTLYLQFGCITTQKFGDVGRKTVEVGKMIVDVLTEAGLKAEWDGTEGKCIAIDPREQAPS